MKWLLGVLASLAVGGVIISACSTDECYDNRNALPYAGFYGVMDGKMEQIRIDSLEVYGIGAPGDSVLSTGKTGISDLYLPFRIDSDTTRYVFRLLSQDAIRYEISDTVTFIYTREARFVSSACGASYLYTIKDIRTAGILIDSLVCPEGHITNADMENLKIYFYTGEALDNE